MPIRMLRDWTDSDKVNKLSPAAERFFIRLIMKADDYGVFYADPRLLRSNLFPLLIDEVSTSKIDTWLNECYIEGLIVKYYAEDKHWIQIVEFGQRKDRMRKKYPLPEDAGSPPEIPANSGLNTNTNRIEKPKPKTNPAPAVTRTLEEEKTFLAFINFINTDAPSVAKMESPFTIDQFFELKKKFTSVQIRDLVVKMGNYKPLVRKNKSAYLTFINWTKNDFNKILTDAGAAGSAAKIADALKNQKDIQNGAN